MKKNKLLLIILTIFTFGISLTGCSKRTIKFGTGNLSGNYYSYGVELSNELNTNLGINIKAMESSGSKANLDLVAKGFFDMGIVQSNDISFDVIKGKTDGYHYQKTLFIEYFQIIVKESSSINTIYDLMGKKVSVGEKGSGTSNTALEVLLSSLGDDYNKVEMIHLSFADSANALKNDEIDAMMIVSSGSTSAIKTIEETVNLKYIPLNDSINSLISSNSGYVKTQIPSNTLKNQTETVSTVGVYATLVFHDGFDLSIETKIIEYIEENNENIIDISFDKEVEETGILKISFNMYLTLTIGILVLLFGGFLRKKIKIFERFCIPAPVIGGLIFCILSLFLYEMKIVEFTFDETLKNLTMMIFFTSVGFQANIKVLKKGGIGLAKLFICVVVLITLQNLTAVGLSKVLNINSQVALLTGSISMTGGHGTASAFGLVFEEMGISGATAIGTAAATFGLVAGSLMGGPVGNRLIKRYKLKPVDSVDDKDESKDNNSKDNLHSIASAIYQIAIAIGFGSIVSYLLSLTGMTFPAYIGSMIVAAIMRNISEYKKAWKTPMKSIDEIGNVSLGLFLGMAMISLKLWQLADLALPMIVLLFAQVILVYFFVKNVVFRVMGKNYDSAVIVAGTCGFSMGATPNAIANMDSITSKYGPSIEAYLIVPIIGAMLMDFANTIIITLFINIIGG